MHNALIIGGTSGIGEAVANKLEKEHGGHFDAVWRPGRAEFDARSLGKIRDYIRKHGPFSHIVYSAGVNVLTWVRDDAIASTMAATYDVNVTGFVATVSEHLRAWPESELSVVAVTSDAAEIPMRGSVAYCASKAALTMAVRVLARELAPSHRVNGVAPGMVEGTAMTEYIDKAVPRFRGWTPERAREYERSSVPTGRRATLDEVADAIVWVLLGPEQMTGSIVNINGGR